MIIGSIALRGFLGTTLQFTDSFALTGISLGTIAVIALYHLSRAIAPAELRADPPVPTGTPPVGSGP